MKKDFIHLMYVPFTGLGLHNGYRGDTWFRDRIEIFKNFTLKGLLNQTEKNFITWFSFRPEEKDNWITQELYVYLKSLKDFRFIFTFGGVMFYDDKYKDEERLLKRLEMTLPDLRELVKDYKWVYQTIQPSDDIFSEHAVERIQSITPEEKVVGFKQGFLLNAGTHELAEYDPTTLPPFSTIMFPTEIFLNPQEHYNYIGPYHSHEFVKDFLRLEELNERAFCVVVHGQNISTVWNHPFKGRAIVGEEKQRLFKKFGIESSDKIKIKRPLYLFLRVCYNKLPNILKESFHWLHKYV